MFSYQRKKCTNKNKTVLNIWISSALGFIEAQYAMKHNSLEEFSEQQIVDCDRGSMGCVGGTMASAFR